MKHKIFIGRVGESQTTNNATVKDLIEASMRMKPDHISLTDGLERVIEVEDLKEIEINK
ncbi:TPA: hypothetical protein M0F92_004588 [Salmonella enterica subsp. enterica serovar Virchow]|nr:hypothetical protein [Salmonella enterica subsp. enterica serovar Virchow]